MGAAALVVPSSLPFGADHCWVVGPSFIPAKGAGLLRVPVFDSRGQTVVCYEQKATSEAARESEGPPLLPSGELPALRLPSTTAEEKRRSAALRAAEFSPEVKATLRACPELTVFDRDIPGFGTYGIYLEDVLEPEDLETYDARPHSWEEGACEDSMCPKHGAPTRAG